MEDLLASSSSANRQRASSDHQISARNRLNRSHYGSTESINSLGSNQGGSKPSRMTQTPNSMFEGGEPDRRAASTSASGTLRPKRKRVEKSNSRVASAGRLRLRVESFRQQQNNGTATQNSKKGAAPPSKPARKTKPAPPPKQQQQQQLRRGSTGEEARSDRSDSPGGGDNSSTSGYSSPSAGGMHSKESSPYGSKVVEKDEVDDGGGGEDEDRSRITVIQIVPATISNRNGGDIIQGEEEDEEENDIDHAQKGSSVDEEDVLQEEMEESLPQSALQAEVMRNNLNRFRQLERELEVDRRKRSSSPPHRELPRIAQIRPMTGQQQQQQQQPKRRLPEARGPPPPPHLLQQYLGGNLGSNQNRPIPNSKPFLAPRGPVGRRIFRQTPCSAPPPSSSSSSSRPWPLPRPFVPPASASSSFLSSPHVPLPPVPELERSDQERESISPSPSPISHPPPPTSAPPPPPPPNNLSDYEVPTNRRAPPPPRPAVRRSHYQHPPRLNHPPPPPEEDYDSGSVQRKRDDTEMESKLTALMSLLNRGNGTGEAISPPHGVDTLQYLSQLEEMAKRLKDQYLMEQPKVITSIDIGNSDS